MSDDELSPEDANRIADAIEDIERNVTRLRELREIPREEYTDDDRQDLRDAVERKFVKLAEAVLDIAETVLDHERYVAFVEAIHAYLSE